MAAIAPGSCAFALRVGGHLHIIWPDIRGRRQRGLFFLVVQACPCPLPLPPPLRLWLSSEQIRAPGKFSGQSLQFPTWKPSQAVYISNQEPSICRITHCCLQWACWNVMQWIIAMTYFGWTTTVDFLNRVLFWNKEENYSKATHQMCLFFLFNIGWSFESNTSSLVTRKNQDIPHSVGVRKKKKTEKAQQKKRIWKWTQCKFMLKIN